MRIGGEGITHLEDGGTTRSRSEATTRVSDDDPAHASIRATAEVERRWPDRTVVAVSRGAIESDVSEFHVTVELDVTLDGAPFHQRRWARSYPRRLL